MSAYISVGTDEEVIERIMIKSEIEPIEKLLGKRGRK
ncbi:hypothetical protein ES708_29553 [subsurface metagenome]